MQRAANNLKGLKLSFFVFGVSFMALERLFFHEYKHFN